MEEADQELPETGSRSDRSGQQPLSQPDREAQPVDDEQPPRLPFPVVGVGASAGGLESFTEFLKAMPLDNGMAFVFILHLPPDHHSLVAEVLARHTKMRVMEAGDGMRVEPDHVYVIRPAHVLTINEGRLHLGPRLDGPQAANRPVDDFFKSLAQEQRERAIAIIMSGMGSNGSAGSQAIKAVGGLCIAQDPETAQFPSMPRHLIDAGYADFIVPPADMPEVLKRYATHPTRRAVASPMRKPSCTGRSSIFARSWRSCGRASSSSGSTNTVRSPSRASPSTSNMSSRVWATSGSKRWPCGTAAREAGRWPCCSATLPTASGPTSGRRSC